jgi:hypothetical protein
MFWLLLAYLLIIRCDYIDGNCVKEGVGCSTEHNKSRVAGMVTVFFLIENMRLKISFSI